MPARKDRTREEYDRKLVQHKKVVDETPDQIIAIASRVTGKLSAELVTSFIENRLDPRIPACRARLSATQVEFDQALDFIVAARAVRGQHNV